MRTGDPVLELEEATVVKRGVAVLDRVTLTIRAGEHTAIIGPNGAGKTALVGLLTHDEHAIARDGTTPVRVFGSDLWDVFDLRSQIGIVSADLHARFVRGNSLGAISVENVVVSGVFATHGIVRTPLPEALRERVREALASVEALHLAGRMLDEMSTGEARRVLIARALMSRPRALVLDEPTAGLDVVARHRFLTAIDAIGRAGTTLVLVTHHLEEVVPCIDRVAFLRGGRVVNSGPKRVLLTHRHLSALFDASVVVREDDGLYRLHLAHAQPGNGSRPVGQGDGPAGQDDN